jgi:formate hydrogenlyase subunit 3/multisubunit Na+/H+ antiporter MnhD subunit
LVLQAVGLGLFGIAGGWALLAGRSVGSGFTDGFHPQFGVDPLSGLFLLALGAVGMPAAVYATAC